MSGPRYPCQVCTGQRESALAIQDEWTVCRDCLDEYQEALKPARENGWSPFILLGWESGLLRVNRRYCQDGEFDELVDIRTRDRHPILDEREDWSLEEFA